jgi:hypothetical protein
MLYVKMLQKLITRGSGRRSAGRSPLDVGLGFTIRFAYPDDAIALRRLAALDSQPVLDGPMLLAEVAGELWAAVALTGEPRAIADPFRPTAELVALLHGRRDRLTHRGRKRVGGRSTATAAVTGR